MYNNLLDAYNVFGRATSDVMRVKRSYYVLKSSSRSMWNSALFHEESNKFAQGNQSWSTILHLTMSYTDPYSICLFSTFFFYYDLGSQTSSFCIINNLQSHYQFLDYRFIVVCFHVYKLTKYIFDKALIRRARSPLPDAMNMHAMPAYSQ